MPPPYVFFTPPPAGPTRVVETVRGTNEGFRFGDAGRGELRVCVRGREVVGPRGREGDPDA